MPTINRGPLGLNIVPEWTIGEKKMKKIGMISAVFVLMFTGLVTPTQALSKTAAYGICQAAIQDEFGKSTLTRLKKIDIFRGNITVIATAVPVDSAKIVATCAFPKAEEGIVSLTTRYAKS
tara:strand:+ start:4964 stop:5326 length:363 start_codon:yes stop_codon:yes gene_type:complete